MAKQVRNVDNVQVQCKICYSQSFLRQYRQLSISACCTLKEHRCAVLVISHKHLPLFAPEVCEVKRQIQKTQLVTLARGVYMSEVWFGNTFDQPELVASITHAHPPQNRAK